MKNFFFITLFASVLSVASFIRESVTLDIHQSSKELHIEARSKAQLEQFIYEANALMYLSRDYHL